MRVRTTTASSSADTTAMANILAQTQVCTKPSSSNLEVPQAGSVSTPAQATKPNGHPTSIEGFNVFLSVGYRIECGVSAEYINFSIVSYPFETTTKSVNGLIVPTDASKVGIAKNAKTGIFD
ncbi:hypothetical protein JAAARDRAFT_61160 [Jaapia argillacea MUCL 33604]|uniref:Uncharacterized protein n=1 Tax=Jaapia argillacea MUCL 33604 TaxID=933084 RepID=A0A067PG58_9AGAM|nr:hypothetical protein JAAARDRAFT_61160 [Jaapia argillacea MUCL 33604]